MACTGIAALCFAVNLRLVLLVDGSGLEQLTAWAEELWGPRSFSQAELALPDTTVLPRPVGPTQQLPPTLGCSPPSQDQLGWKRTLRSLSPSYCCVVHSGTRLHCQVQFISTVPVTVKAGSGLGWSRCWPAVSLGYPAVISGSQAGPASAGNMGCRVRRDGSREGLCPSHLPRAFWCQQAMDVHLAVSYPQHWWRCGQQCTGIKYNDSCYHPAPDVIQPWDNLPRSFSSLHRVVLLVPNPCRACEAQQNVAVWIQTCLDSKHSQQFLKLGGALLVGGSWVINPPLFPCLNSSSVPQKPHFKHWDRMVPVRAIPRFGFLVSQMHIGIIFSPSGSISTVCSYWVRAYKMICKDDPLQNKVIYEILNAKSGGFRHMVIAF